MALGILCLETYWSNDITDRRTVSGLLDLLETNVPGLQADHRHIGTRSDLAAILEGGWRWDRYDVLYLAVHGEAGAVFDEYNEKITLEWLGKRMGGRCAGRVIFLASCSTVDVSAARAKRFLDSTGAAALVGYTTPVEWLAAAEMDLLVLGALADAGPDANGIWPEHPGDVLEDLASQHEGFVDELGWHIVRTDEVPAGSRRSIPDGAVDALDALFGLAEDEDLDERDRVAAVSATGRLRIWDPRIAELVRDRANAPRIRRAAAKALVDADSASSRQATARLLKRLDANPDDDPGGGIRKILIRAPVEGRSR